MDKDTIEGGGGERPIPTPLISFQYCPHHNRTLTFLSPQSSAAVITYNFHQENARHSRAKITPALQVIVFSLTDSFIDPLNKEKKVLEPFSCMDSRSGNLKFRRPHDQLRSGLINDHLESKMVGLVECPWLYAYCL